MKLKLTIIAFLLMFNSFSQITWTPLNQIPNAIYSPSSETRNVVIDGTVYIFDVGLLHSYDVNSDTWQVVADYPGVYRQGAYLFALGHKIYVVGGLPFDPNSSSQRTENWEYDLDTDTWTQKADIPLNPSLVTQYSLATFTYNNEAYLLDYVQKGFYKYEQNTDTWVALTSFPPTILQASIKPWFLIDHKFYTAFDGASESLPDEFWEYDFSTGNWNRLNDAPIRFNSSAFFTLGEYGYAGLGNNNGNLLNTFYKYNPVSDTWITLNNAPFNGWMSMSFSVNHTGYVTEGLNNERSFWRFEDTTNMNVSENDFNNISIYPNPVSTNDILKTSNKNLNNKKYTIYNLLGKEIKSGFVKNGMITSLSEKGIYLLRIDDLKSSVFIVK